MEAVMVVDKWSACLPCTPTINLPNYPTFLGNFCKGVKIFNFSSEIIFGHIWKFFEWFLKLKFIVQDLVRSTKSNMIWPDLHDLVSFIEKIDSTLFLSFNLGQFSTIRYYYFNNFCKILNPYFLTPHIKYFFWIWAFSANSMFKMSPW